MEAVAPVTMDNAEKKRKNLCCQCHNRSLCAQQQPRVNGEGRVQAGTALTCVHCHRNSYSKQIKNFFNINFVCKCWHP